MTELLPLTNDKAAFLALPFNEAWLIIFVLFFAHSFHQTYVLETDALSTVLWPIMSETFQVKNVLYPITFRCHTQTDEKSEWQLTNELTKWAVQVDTTGWHVQTMTYRWRMILSDFGSIRHCYADESHTRLAHTRVHDRIPVTTKVKPHF